MQNVEWPEELDFLVGKLMNYMVRCRPKHFHAARSAPS